MPPREPRALLEDALGQIEELLRKVADSSLDQLLASRDLQAIFERRFEVLGESLRRFERSDASIFARAMGARQAVDLRNFISHGYDGIDHRVLWSTAADDLQPMRDSIRAQLAMSD